MNKKQRITVWASAGVIFLTAAVFACLLLGGFPDPAGKTAEPADARPAAADAQSAAEPAELPALVISELCPSNGGSYVDADGDFPDWVELENRHSEAVELDGWMLSDKEDGAGRWRFPELTLQPGERLLVLCDGKNGVDAAGAPHAGFSLAREGECLVLSAPDGRQADLLRWTDCPQGSSLIPREGEADACDATGYPTPGEENSYAGYLRLCESDSRESPLLINEVVTYDDRYLPSGEVAVLGQHAMTYYDWLELKNVSARSLRLSDYCLSDDDAQRDKHPLPDVTLEPGGVYIVVCQKEDVPADCPYDAAPFGLRRGETILLTGADGTLRDWCTPGYTISGHSYGRMTGENGFFYFETATPGAENGAGRRSYGARPQADVAPGVYNDAQELTVALSGEGEIRYTLDGSLPTAASPRYSEPLRLTESTVLRAVCQPEGRLASPAATFSYILHEGEALPVVSLAADPVVFTGRGGIYLGSDKNWSCEANMSFFEEGGSASLDCDLSLHGNGQLKTDNQKGLQMDFRDRLDGPMEYDLFDDGMEEFTTLMLRTGFSREYYYVADMVYTELAEQSCTDLEWLRGRFVSVYINGRYWGLYQLRDRYCRDYFAKHWGVSPESVEIVRTAYRTLGGTTLYADLKWIAATDMTVPENYAALLEIMDMDSLAEWVVIQAFSGNGDQYTNLKFVRSSETDNRWRAILYDVDRPMMLMNSLEGLLNSTAYYMREVFPQLFKSPEFRELLLEKASYMLHHGLTTENTLAIYQRVLDEVGDQVVRSMQRWNVKLSRWRVHTSNLLRYYVAYDMPGTMIKSADRLFQLSDAEMERYFGDLLGG